MMLMCNLIECGDNYSKASRFIRQYCRGETALNDNGYIDWFNAANTSTNLFKIKRK